jgi:hypothetical protein
MFLLLCHHKGTVEIFSTSWISSQILLNSFLVSQVSLNLVL